MRVACALCVLVAFGCERGAEPPAVDLPRVSPDTVIVSWSVISRTPDRDSVHAVLEANRKLTTTTRSPDGTMISASRTISPAEYEELVRRLRALQCCSIESTTSDRAHPGEAKPLLEVDLGDVQCEVELWDREWREGRARECALAAARVHRAGFVPDPPVDVESP